MNCAHPLKDCVTEQYSFFGCLYRFNGVISRGWVDAFHPSSVLRPTSLLFFLVELWLPGCQNSKCETIKADKKYSYTCVARLQFLQRVRLLHKICLNSEVKVFWMTLERNTSWHKPSLNKPLYKPYLYSVYKQFVYEMFWVVFHIGNLQKALLFFLQWCPAQTKALKRRLSCHLRRSASLCPQRKHVKAPGVFSSDVIDNQS